jgi:hypothetical protein
MADPNPPNASGWQISPHRPLPPSGAVAAADWTLDRLATLGVTAPPGNRLQRARNLLSKVNAQPDLIAHGDDRFRRLVAEAQRTIYEQYIITRTSAGRTDVVSDTHRAKLEQMLSGADLPEDDKNFLARNTQFELYSAAMFGMGQVPIGHAEPDFQFEFLNGEVVGLAAKRISSPKQLRTRVKEGIEQIKNAGVRGFVAVNVEVYTRSIRLEEEESKRGDQFNSAIQALHDVFDEFKDDPHFLGIINFGHVLEWDDTGAKPILGMHDFRQFGVVSEDDDYEAQAIEFVDTLWTNVQKKLNNL